MRRDGKKAGIITHQAVASTTDALAGEGRHCEGSRPKYVYYSASSLTVEEILKEVSILMNSDEGTQGLYISLSILSYPVQCFPVLPDDAEKNESGHGDTSPEAPSCAVYSVLVYVGGHRYMWGTQRKRAPPETPELART